jgi:histidinol dehydrogenase
MIQIITYKKNQNLKKILQRPQINNDLLFDSVRTILKDVKTKGNKAVKNYTAKFDGVMLKGFAVSKKEFAESNKLIGEDLKKAIRQAAENISKFHKAQLKNGEIVETMPGVRCWRKSVAIEKVGLYIPGGTAPLFSTLLMLGIPAKLAGCKEIIVCSPSDKNGKIHPAILHTASLIGIEKFYKIGGAQAIAAMAYGTETIPRVYKIFGPGNQYVTAAKQLIQLDGIAIDMPAGPSEVCILADETANPVFVASDMLAQLEHGADSQAILVCTSQIVVDKVLKKLEKQIVLLKRKKIIVKSLKNAKAIIAKNLDEAVDVINEYAPEHLIICCAKAEKRAEKIFNAGSVFIGNDSAESAGDYASGTNHTLPTNGFAKAYSGVSVDSFVKKITFQKIDQNGLKNIASTVISMAEAEGLDAHANSIKLRLNV